MHDINELEKRWRRYKLKKYALPIVLAVIAVFAAGALFGVLFFDTGSKQPAQAEKEIEHNATSPKTGAKTSKTKQEKEANTTTVKMEPKLPSVTNATDRTVKLQAYEPDMQTLVSNQDRFQKPPPTQKQEPAAKPKTPDKPVQKEETKQSKRQERQKDLDFTQSSDGGFDPKTIEQRYAKEANVDDARLLANYYYDHGEYKNASKWSYKLNQLDPNQEDGWLIFAKSLYKRGRHDDAVNVLQGYLSNVASQEANRLLQDMISGEFQ
ncbi:MAG: CDC27 family protein [Campylobacterota bacterium]